MNKMRRLNIQLLITRTLGLRRRVLFGGYIV